MLEKKTLSKFHQLRMAQLPGTSSQIEGTLDLPTTKAVIMQSILETLSISLPEGPPQLHKRLDFNAH